MNQANALKREDLIEFENEIASLFNAGQIRAPVHLYHGNEDRMIEVFRDVKPDDWVFRRKEMKEAFQAAIAGAGIESRPLIDGNLLRQPFLQQYYDPISQRNADFMHDNAFYIGNNQFVDAIRLGVLHRLMDDFFKAV